MSTAPIMIMAGGTGGHVFPGLAVASELQAQDRSVIWLGTRRGLEAELVPARGIEIEWISIAGVRGKGLIAWLVAPVKIVWSILQALGVMLRRRPGAVLGLGGFVAGPGGIAAWLTRKPLIIHEQNAVAGTTNRLLARRASRVYEAFPDSFPGTVGAIEIGNPVRDSILGANRDRGVSDQAANGMHVLVLGGSQGALILNETVPAALAQLPPTARPQVRHQAGRSLSQAETAYAATDVEVDCFGFIDDMAEAYAWADIVIARAGALTLAELSAAGVAAILVPYPHAIDDHQLKNAEHLARAGGAIVLPQDELTPERLAQELASLLDAPERVASMGAASRTLMRPDAARQLAAACIELAGDSR